MKYDKEYFNSKWSSVIKLLPTGGSYRFDLRQHCYDIIKNNIPKNSKVFDYACGLGIIDIQLAKENKCKISGCDYSNVAIDYIKSKIKQSTHFKANDKIKGIHDYILAIYYLEHIAKPVKWLLEAFEYTKKVIAVIPNDFRQYGEHQNMAWTSWDSFYKTFSIFKVKRLDTVIENDKEVSLYPDIPHAFKHPILELTK